MLSALLGLIGIDLKREVRNVAVTIALAASGAFLAILTIAIALRALYLWLEVQWGTFLALGILGALSAILAAVLFYVAFRSKRAKPPTRRENPLSASAAAMAEAGEQAMNEATDAVSKGSRKQMYSTLLIAVLAGLILGRRF